MEIDQSSWLAAQEDQNTDSYILHIHWVTSETQYFYIFFIPWQFERKSLLSNGLHMMRSDADHENNQKILLSQLDGTSHNAISHPFLNLRRRNQNYHSSTPEAAKTQGKCTISHSYCNHQHTKWHKLLFSALVLDERWLLSVQVPKERLWSHLTASFSFCSCLINMWPRKETGPENAIQ